MGDASDDVYSAATAEPEPESLIEDRIWTTADGRRLPIEEMTDEHVINALRMCRRRESAAADAAAEALAFSGGEHAVDSAHGYAETRLSESISWAEWSRVLRAECERRFMMLPREVRIAVALWTASYGGESAELPLQRESHFCHCDRDGECRWWACPQLIDGEPAATGRSCPLPDVSDDEEALG